MSHFNGLESLVVSRTRDERLEVNELTKAINIPFGVIITSIVRYSSSVSNSTTFLEGYNFIDNNFKKITKELNENSQ